MKPRIWLAAGVLGSVLIAVAAFMLCFSYPGRQTERSRALPAAPTQVQDGPTRPASAVARPSATGTQPSATATQVVVTAEAEAQPSAARPILARGRTIFFEITVGQIDYAQEFASHSTDAKLCIIPLTVTNTSSEAKVFVAADVYMLDAENHRHSAVHNEGFSMRIPPDSSESGKLVYEMDEEASPHRLVFIDSSHPDQILLSLSLEP